jgi:hypothetical protein
MPADLLANCRSLLAAYRSGDLGQTRMPEDSNPGFADDQAEARLAYFTLPMALNYQRDSYKLWEAALKTWNDPEARTVFDVTAAVTMPEEKLRELLLRHRVALQPNKHVATWRKIAGTVQREWGSFQKLLAAADNDFAKLRELVQAQYKAGFPYLSGPKIFNYWCFVLGPYGGVTLGNREGISIAPDTHITRCSIRLGVVTQEEADILGRDEIATRWAQLLSGSGIAPIDMHPPLWFWSRNGFLYDLPPVQR